jgi:carbonic anhydrase
MSLGDVLPAYKGTPVEDLLAYHNLGMDFRDHPNPQLLIATCMDFRVAFRLPKDFAYIIRAGGANTRGLEFHISAAVAQGVNAICVVGHNKCAMCGVSSRKEPIVRGLVSNGGWEEREAENHFDECAPNADINNVEAFVRSEAERVGERHPAVLVAPLLYSVEDRLLYQVKTT